MRQLDGAGIDGPLAPYGAGFAEWLMDQGYATSSVGHHLGLVGWLSRWLAEEDLGTDDLSEVVVHRFPAGQATGRPRATECRAETAAEVSARLRRRSATRIGAGVTATTSAVGLRTLSDRRAESAADGGHQVPAYRQDVSRGRPGSVR